MICFGPIPSRRLGLSLGINNIPEKKICTYSCVYCQIGRTKNYSVNRQSFFEPEEILVAAETHLSKLDVEDQPDYLTFVSNGEPTLDINLGRSVRLLQKLHIPVAVITNASLLNNRGVAEDLNQADWVSVKIDSVDEKVWKAINRPHKSISFPEYIDGLMNFSKSFQNNLVTETMIVAGINDKEHLLEETAKKISEINPSTAYLSVPTRPPAEKFVHSPDESTLNKAFQIFSARGLNTELIIGFEGTNTGYTGNAREDIVNICSVHPIREDTMQELLKKNRTDRTTLDDLLEEGKIKELSYNGKTFYLRKFHKAK
jgi:wyosine [tRNA(Phe)-imidazoG37] synthetase (radical SAM superfamily)